MDKGQIEKDIGGLFEAVAAGDNESLTRVLTTVLAGDAFYTYPRHEHNKVLPYTGEWRGVEQILQAHKLRREYNRMLEYKILDVVVQGQVACVTTYNRACQVHTQVIYELETMHRLDIDEQGRVSHWRVYCDSSLEAVAFTADLGNRLINAVCDGDLAAVRQLLDAGADADSRDLNSGLTVLMLAAGLGNADITRCLLDAGADVYTKDARAGAGALHKSCQGGNPEVARMLVEAGAFVDDIAATTGHTPLIEAIWYKQPQIVEYLLSQNAGLHINTHYGFTLLEHMQYALKVNMIDKDKLRQAADLVEKRRRHDETLVAEQKLMQAVTEDNLDAVRQLLGDRIEVDQRSPVINGFNDDHTPLLVACRDGHTEIARILLEAGADVNATEPTFGAVPLHKATYNGHADITAMLAAQSGVDLDYQGPSNGYTPLHDALWHGFDQCAKVLVEAGARLDLKGHDGKTPLAIATETLGTGHALVALMEHKMGIVA